MKNPTAEQRNFVIPNGNNDNNQKRFTTIMGVAIAALLGLCVFLLVSKHNVKNETKIYNSNWLKEAERVVKEMRGGGLVCKEDEQYLIFNPDKKIIAEYEARKKGQHKATDDNPDCDIVLIKPYYEYAMQIYLLPSGKIIVDPYLSEQDGYEIPGVEIIGYVKVYLSDKKVKISPYETWRNLFNEPPQKTRPYEVIKKAKPKGWEVILI